MPALAKEESLEGAQAFLDYWSDAMWFANQTGNTKFVREVVSTSCERCYEQFDVIDEVYARDAWFIGGRERVEIQDESLVRAVDGVYKPVSLANSEGIKLVENGRITYEAEPRKGLNDPFPIYLDYRNGKWLYITAANMPGVGEMQ
ncbi:DUF6318 family protein [Kocuria flava]|nr:DUF6318 family protein [Kocuria flava]